MQNRELVKQESKLPATSEERQFEISLKGNKVSLQPIEELKEVLRLVMVKVGLRAQNWPTDIEKTVLLDHIVKEYGLHTHEEIMLAFDMAITGKLNVESNCYENFSCAYFSNIMNAYRIWAGSVHKQIKQPVLEEPKEDLNDITMQDWWNDVSNKVRNHGLKAEFMPVMLYTWKQKKGRIKASEQVRDEYLNRALGNREDAKKLFIHDLMKNENVD